jgi:hypothetical protein
VRRRSWMVGDMDGTCTSTEGRLVAAAALMAAGLPIMEERHIRMERPAAAGVGEGPPSYTLEAHRVCHGHPRRGGSAPSRSSPRGSAAHTRYEPSGSQRHGSLFHAAGLLRLCACSHIFNKPPREHPHESGGVGSCRTTDRRVRSCEPRIQEFHTVIQQKPVHLFPICLHLPTVLRSGGVAFARASIASNRITSHLWG